MSEQNDPNGSGPPPAEPGAGRRREVMLAFHLGALDEDEEALIKGRLATNPEWQQAGAEAQAMLAGLKEDGVAKALVPEGLGEKTLQRLDEQEAASAPELGATVRRQWKNGALSEDSTTRRIRLKAHGASTDWPRPVIRAFFTPRLAAAIFAACLLPVLLLAGRYYWSSGAGASILWRAEGEMAAGAPFTPFLQVRDGRTQRPTSGVKLVAYLAPTPGGGDKTPVGEGVTDSAGVLSGPPWRVPEVAAGDYRLVIEARSGMGSVLDMAERSVKISRSAKLALAPDRTQARPGETVRVRTLMVSRASDKPLVDRLVNIDLFDPQNNRLGRVERRSTRFGLAWAEFPLDSSAPEGTYRLRAESDGLTVERPIEVKQYVLPPFRVTVTPERKWFNVGEQLVGAIEAHTFDGHPVANAKGEATLYDAVGNVAGGARVQLDAEGKGRFALARSGLLRGETPEAAVFRLAVNLTDAADRSAGGQVLVHVSSAPLLLTAVAEGGDLVPGLENRVYVVARAPDGTPAQARLRVIRNTEDTPREVATDDQGVALVTLANVRRPAEVLQISDAGGTASKTLTLRVRPAQRGLLLLRPDKVIVRGGETLKVSVLAGEALAARSVALALRQDGRTVCTGGVILNGTQAQAELKVPPGVTGALTLEGSLALDQTSTWLDSHMLLVNGDNRVQVAAAADRTQYRPGDRAKLNFSVTDAAGAGVPAAVSVVGVDDALLSLTGEHPGLAQALAAAGVNLLSQPGFPLDATAFTPAEGGTQAAYAALAGAKPKPASAAPAETVINTAPAKIALAEESRKETTQHLNQWLFALAGIGLVLLLLRLAFHSFENVYNAIPALTLVCCAMGFAGVAALSGGCGEFLLLMFITLVLGHVCVFAGIKENRYDVSALNGTAILGDILIGIAALWAWNATGRDLSALGFIFALGVAVAVLWQLDVARPPTARVRVSLGAVLASGAACLVIAYLFMPVFAGTRHRYMSMGLEDEEMMGAPRQARPTTAAPKTAAEPSVTVPGMDGDIRVTDGEIGVIAGLPSRTGKWSGNNGKESPSTAPPPRLRWDFPEALIFAPQIITDEHGKASLDVTVSDSLTKWRVQSDAISASGGTSWTQTQLLVTQPLSVDLALPSDVTAGDLLHVPAVISNHSDTEKVVDVTLEAGGATILDSGERQQVRIGAKSVTAAEFTVRFDKPATTNLKVTARVAGTGEQDLVERALSVLPDGRPFSFTASALIGDDGELEIIVPDDALPGTIAGSLYLHRGPLTQMLEGLESMLREPNGCFEQTSSATYPNIMILRYLKANGVNKPAIETRAQDFIARGCQRLLGFEVAARSGSFSLYGRAPASTWLTAYGLQEFSDMAAVYPVDPALLERVRAFLRTKMRGDGSFEVDDYRGHESAALGLASTAYVVLALGDGAPPQSVQLLRSRSAEIERDGYLCALAANALLKADRATAAQFAAHLRGLAQITPTLSPRGRGQGEGVAVLSGQTTLAWGYGNAASVEASALGVLALLQTGQDMDLVKQLLAGIQAHAAGGGGWGSTHATVLALKALEAASSVGRKAGPARVLVTLNGNILPALDLPAEESAVPAVLPLQLPRAKSRVRIQVDGGPIAARVSGTAVVPWSDSQVAAQEAGALQARATYDSATVEKGRSVLGTLTVFSRGRRAEVPMVEWGLAAGFSPDPTDLESLKSRGLLSRWEVSGRKLRLYLPDLAANANTVLPVRFQAATKGTLTAHVGRVYEYYRSSEAVALAPARFEVK